MPGAADPASRLGAPGSIELSVVAPAHDEAPNLERLAREVRATLDARGLRWELIVVDDGSADDTPEVLARCAAADRRVRHVRLAHRSGQTAALVAGWRSARGSRIATLDADLQCPPAQLPALLDALGTADLVCGVRRHRRDPLRRRFVSSCANLLRRCVLAPRLRDLACPLRVFRADALARLEAAIPLFDGAHRWLPALFALAGLRVVQRPVAHEPRRAGASKYSATGRVGPIARETGRVFEIALRRRPGFRLAVALAALALLAIPFLYHLGAWPLTEPDEGRNAEVAREMLQLGNWSVPHFNDLPYLDKPVLLFWTTAALFRALGPSEFVARLPSALSAIATIALTFAIARALLGARRAVLAALIVATAPLVLVFARAAIFDMLLTALVTAALFALLQARRTGDVWRWWPLAGAAMGLAVLCKGPVGVAVPLLAWIAGRGALPPPPRRARVLPAAAAATLAATAIVLPWLALVRHAEPGFLRYAVLDETFLRMIQTKGFHRAGPPYYYVVVLAWATGAWGAALLAAASALTRHWRDRGADAAAIAFAARAATAIVVFFSLLASKRPQYILPALVPLSVLVAAGVDAAPWRVGQTVRALGVIALATSLVAALAVHADFTPAHGHLRVVTPAAVAALGAALCAWGLLATLGGRSPLGAIACLALLGPLLGLRMLTPLAPYAESRSARRIAGNIPADSTVVCLQTFHTSLPFYLRRPVVLVSRDGHELTSRYVLAQRDRFMGGTYLQPVERFGDVIGADRNVVVLTKERAQDVDRLAKRPFVPLYSQRRNLLLRPAG